MGRRVEDVMTKSVAVVRDSAPFKEILGIMHARRVSALPVVDDEDRLVGIVSEADLLLKEEYADAHEDADLPLFERRARRIEREKAAGTVASELMTTPVITIGPSATLAEAARLMHEEGVKRLPVVDAKGRVAGIVSRADLLKVFLRRDDEIRTEVIEEVIQDKLFIDPDTIKVNVETGLVTLDGRVEQRSLIPILVAMVRGVDGVVGVESRLQYEVDDVTLRPEVMGPWGLLPYSLRES
jgi:CBS-domain-containing membrane protein